jgi:hypothetical protein
MVFCSVERREGGRESRKGKERENVPIRYFIYRLLPSERRKRTQSGEGWTEPPASKFNPQKEKNNNRRMMA